MSGLVPRAPAADPLGGTRFSAAHPDAPPPLADPRANRMDRPENWAHDYRPRRAVAVPPGHLAVQMMNAQPTSAGNHMPGDVAVLRGDEARALVRQGYARPVLTA